MEESTANGEHELLWSRENVEKFIEIFKENICLYDRNFETFNDNLVKTHALQNIVCRMQVFIPNLEFKDVHDKIREIRTQLSEEISLVNTAKASGQKYEPKLWCYNQLEFLWKHVTIDNILEENQNISDDEDVQSDTSEVSLYTEMQNKETEQPYTQFRWTQEGVALFIKLLSKYELLWDINHKHHQNRNARIRTFHKLLKEAKKIDPAISMNNVREKIKGLRRKFMREVDKIKRAERNNEAYTPTWWCFNKLIDVYKDIDLKSDNNKLNIERKSPNNDYISDQSDEYSNDNTMSNELFEFEEIDKHNEEVYDEETATLPNSNENLMSATGYKRVYTFDDSIENLKPPKKKSCYTVNSNNNKNDNKEANKFENKLKTGKNSNNETVSYKWLGDLVESQLGEISQTFYTKLSQDVQCVIRKYISKTKSDKDEISTINSI